MTNNTNNERVREIVFAINALKKEGITEPTAEQIQDRVDTIRAIQARDVKKLKEISKKKQARQLQELEEAPKFVEVDLGGGEKFVSESGASIECNRIQYFADRLNKVRNGRSLYDLELPVRHRMGSIFDEATSERLCSKVCMASGISRDWAQKAKRFVTYVPFIEQLIEILEFAAEKKFKLTWSHVQAAMTTKRTDLCIYWLKSAIENKYSPWDLERKIANNADRKIRGKTRKHACIDAIGENIEDHDNLAAKVTTLVHEKEDIEPVDMPLESFLKELFFVTDTGFFC